MVNAYYGPSVLISKAMVERSDGYRDPHDEATAGHRTQTAHRVALMVLYKDFDVCTQPASITFKLCNNKLFLREIHPII